MSKKSHTPNTVRCTLVDPTGRRWSVELVVGADPDVLLQALLASLNLGKTPGIYYYWREPQTYTAGETVHIDQLVDQFVPDQQSILVGGNALVVEKIIVIPNGTEYLTRMQVGTDPDQRLRRILYAIGVRATGKYRWRDLSDETEGQVLYIDRV